MLKEEQTTNLLFRPSHQQCSIVFSLFLQNNETREREKKVRTETRSHIRVCVYIEDGQTKTATRVE